jgi:hypothetical protein
MGRKQRLVRAQTERRVATHLTNRVKKIKIGPPTICDFLRREDELMTELMNHKRSTLS